MSPPSPAASTSAAATARRARSLGAAARQARQVIWIALLAAVVLIAGSLQLTRAGYSVDEEFTVFAVRGIQATGLPILPSGLLYDRGLAYSYAAWFAGLITGSELPAFRAISLICAALIVGFTFVLIKRVANEGAALIASLLVTLSVPFWATATSGRFYAPFLALYLATLLSMRSAFLIVAALAMFCRLTHELAFTLAIVPAVGWVFERERRRHWVWVMVAMVAGLVAGQVLLLAFHYSAPASGETMVRRFFLWQVLNLFERPGDRQFMIPVIVTVLTWIVAPKRAWAVSVIGLSLAAMILAFSIAVATNSAPLSWALIKSVLVEGSRYPLDMFWPIAKATPLTMLMALAGLILRAAGLGRHWAPGERALHLLWIGWVLWFGVIESGITTNYLLLPVTFMLMAIAVDLHAIQIDESAPVRRYFSDPHQPAVLRVFGAIVFAALLAHDQWRGAGSMAARFDAARPTIVGDGLTDVRATLHATDRVVCTDELGCLMLIGRIDRWLALDDYVRERFLVRRGDAPIAGVYTGAPAVFRPSDLFESNPDGSLPDRILIVDIFKEYPIGNSRSWLPRAIEEDGVQVTPLLETPQLRVLQVSPPQRQARLRSPGTFRATVECP